MTDIFRSLDGDSVLAATAEHWSLDAPLPLPIGDWLRCPVCRNDIVQVRYWMFHARPKLSTLRYRCDVNFKCCACAAIWAHGVALPDAYWQRHGLGKEKRKIDWRQARKMLRR